jgi:beta-carotene/zeaxanthin 4-ketolase
MKHKGLFFAFSIITLWGLLLGYFLHYKIEWDNPLVYVFVLVQTHLYTGIFITAHDAIHGVVAPDNKRLNYWIGLVCATIFAYNNYEKLSM